MNNLVEDLNKLTTISTSKLEHLSKLAVACIGEEFMECKLSEASIMDYDIGIGRLIVGVRDGEIKYKFIPSDILHTSLLNITKGKRNLLETKVEKSLVNCIENTYKDLL